MGNLWVVTVDKSGSMLWDENENYRSFRRIVISKSVRNRLANKVIPEMMDFSRDEFFFFDSGILNTTDIRHLRYQESFDQSFIHFYNNEKNLVRFANKRGFDQQLKRQMEGYTYKYRYSFVSLIRIYAFIKALTEIKRQGLTDKFNKIYLLTITDDADQNDQWRMDYRRVKKFAPNLFKEVEKDLTRYVYNPLNSKQQSESTGAFELVHLDDSRRTHINVYEYSTFASNEVPITNPEFFSLNVGDEASLFIKSEKNMIEGNLIEFTRIDSILTDGGVQYFNSEISGANNTFPIDIAGSYFDTRKKLVRINGIAEVSYEDPLLGPRRKRYPIDIQYELYGFRTQEMIYRLSILVLVILILWLVYHLLVRPGTTYFKVYDSIGNGFSFRKGSLRTGFWKKGILDSMVFNTDEEGNATVINSKKGRIYRASASTETGEFDSLLFTSYRDLQVSPGTDEVTISEFETRVDFVEEMDAESHPELFDRVYRETVPQRFIDSLHHSKLIGKGFKRLMLKLTRPYWYKKFYLASFPVGMNKAAHLVRFGNSKSLPGRTFEVTLSNNDATGPGKSQECLNEFFETNKKADSLIILEVNEGSIHSLVFKTEYKDQLKLVKQIYENIIRFEGPITPGHIGTIRQSLKKAMRRGTMRLRNAHCRIIDHRNASGVQTIAKSFNVVSESKNQFPFKLDQAPFCNCLFLVEDKVGELGKAHLIYSPFDDHQKTEFHLESPDEGSYFLHEGAFPKWSDNLKKPFHQRRLYQLSLSFAMKSTITLGFEGDGKKILLESRSIPYKSNG